MTGWPSAAEMPGARIRVTASCEPPAAYGTTTVTGRAGQACAAAEAAQPRESATAAPGSNRRRRALSTVRSMFPPAHELPPPMTGEGSWACHALDLDALERLV